MNTTFKCRNQTVFRVICNRVPKVGEMVQTERNKYKVVEIKNVYDAEYQRLNVVVDMEKI